MNILFRKKYVFFLKIFFIDYREDTQGQREKEKQTPCQNITNTFHREHTILKFVWNLKEHQLIEHSPTFICILGLFQLQSHIQKPILYFHVDNKYTSNFTYQTSKAYSCFQSLFISVFPISPTRLHSSRCSSFSHSFLTPLSFTLFVKSIRKDSMSILLKYF